VDLDERFAADMNAKVIPSFFCVRGSAVYSEWFHLLCNFSASALHVIGGTECGELLPGNAKIFFLHLLSARDKIVIRVCI
jgi:hypothetical protein